MFCDLIVIQSLKNFSQEKQEPRKDRGVLLELDHYIFFTGSEARKSWTDEEGTTVCWAGLCIPLTSLANICAV